jgi:hypothetical protein
VALGGHLSPSSRPDDLERLTPWVDNIPGAYDAAHAAWIDAVAKQRAVVLKAQTGPASPADLTPILPDRNSGEQRDLRDREAEARSAREAAADRLVNARTATWAAETAARRRERT